MVWDPSSLNDSALASVAMGYQVGVTPLQMAAAVSAVANGGELVQPRAVRAVIRDGRRLPVPHKALDRVASAGTMATLTEIMEKVVEDGTGKRAQVPGYTVAGKTGTAKKLVNGSYRGHSDYNVSFVGFVPSRKPVFTIVVVVDSPHRVSPVRRCRRRADLPENRRLRHSGSTAYRHRSTRRSRCSPVARKRRVSSRLRDR